MIFRRLLASVVLLALLLDVGNTRAEVLISNLEAVTDQDQRFSSLHGGVAKALGFTMPSDSDYFLDSASLLLSLSDTTVCPF